MSAERSSRGGRPRHRMLDLPVYDTMTACSAHTGIPLSVLSTAKNSGCKAFQHSRVDLQVLLRWLFTNEMKTEEEEVNWAKFDKRMSGLLKEHKLLELRKQVVQFAEVTRIINAIVRDTVFAELERDEQTFPQRLKGKNPVEIHQECVRRKDQMKTAIEAHLQRMEEK